MSEWRPIKTAPKDGTPMDVWHVCIDPKWRPEGEECRFADVEWCVTEDGEGWAQYSDTWAAMILLPGAPHYQVTHWMPIPGPPK